MTGQLRNWALAVSCLGLVSLGCRSKGLVAPVGGWINGDAGPGRTDAHGGGARDVRDAPAREVRLLDAPPAPVDGRPDFRSPDVARDVARTDAPASDAARFREPCSSNDECNGGICADAVCCATPCSGSCVSCALPGYLGTCEPVPAGHADPHGLCSSGQVCGDPGAGCVGKGCLADQDCGDTAWCTDGHCQPCAATCTSDADCLVHSVCVHRNSCTFCAPRDAGATAI